MDAKTFVAHMPDQAASTTHAGPAHHLVDRSKVADDIRRLSELTPWKATFGICTQWVIILASFVLAISLGHWLGYLLASIVIATRQHALGVLMHEGAHYRLYHNRLLNDIVSDLFCAFPIGLCTRFYRMTHLAHHRHLNTDGDPDFVGQNQDEDWCFPKARIEFIKVFLKDLLGLNSWKVMKGLSAMWSPWKGMFKSHDDPESLTWTERLLLLGSLAVTAVLLALAGWRLALTVLALWFVPSLTILTAIFRLRSIAEHRAVANTHELNASRNVYPHWAEIFLLAPCHVNYHLDHHLFPSVPFYNLPKLHRRLLEEKSYRENIHVSHSYTGLRRGVAGELIRSKSKETLHQSSTAIPDISRPSQPTRPHPQHA